MGGCAPRSGSQGASKARRRWRAFKDSIRDALPRPVVRPVQLAWNAAAQELEAWSGRRSREDPPRIFGYDGRGGVFERVGAEYLGHFIGLGGLEPQDRVLEVGCGPGRMARQLTTYMAPEGSYEGFDLVGAEVRWYQTHITPKFPNFHFRLEDVYNKKYRPEGRLAASLLTFPYPDSHFDFAFMTSVLTHMLPADLQRYVTEVARVLKSGRRCLLTFFLLNDESLRCMRGGKPRFHFVDTGEGYHTVDRETPEEAVAYEEEYVRKLLGESGLDLLEPVHYGGWSGRAEHLSGQDIVVAAKC